MKNATKHADVLRSVCKKLIREYKPEPKQPREPLPALVRAAMSYDVPDAKAEDAMRAIEKEFVDLNEFRVATELEVQELLGQRYPEIETRVTMITAALNNIFEREHTMNLERLKTISKRDARQFLRELPGIHPFVEASVMMYAFDAPAFPIDDEILSYLVEEETMEEGTPLADAQRFVEHQLKADELYDLFAALRVACYEDGKRKKRK
ncbi:MAG: hypothetical protein H7Z14_14100 [Anaerolineae bacterium]|nr:hypothetical protein [Phycisphaerae bacterium]